MGWQERFQQIVNFRLIEPGFDGNKKLRIFLGLDRPTKEAAVEERPVALTLSGETDRATLDAYMYLTHQTDEEPNLQGPYPEDKPPPTDDNC